MKFKAQIAAATIRLLVGSLRFRFVVDDPDTAPQRMAGPGLYIFWHEMLLLPAYTHSREITPLISASRDGDLMDAVVRSFGGSIIRGSTDHGKTDRGGRRALREMLRQGKTRHLAIPVDGPIGPSRKVSPGAVFLASRSGMPIVPVGLAPRWFVSFGPEGRKVNFPAPLCRAWIVLGKPIRIRPELPKSELRAAVESIQAAMDEVQSRAEKYVRTDWCGSKPMTLGEFRTL